MLTVSGLARRSGATVHAVRYYTRRGLLQPLQDPGNGYHFYLPRDVRRLRFIRQAKELGYTLNDIGEILGEADHGQSPCPRVREILQKHIVENRRRLESLGEGVAVLQADARKRLMAFRTDTRYAT